jgi:hypothetical protein
LKSIVGIAAIAALMTIAGCGGVATLDSQETQTVTLAKSAVATAAKDRSLKPGDEQKLNALIILCRKKPLAEADGMSMREILADLAPQLTGVDPNLSAKLKRIATSGCE